MVVARCGIFHEFFQAVCVMTVVCRWVVGLRLAFHLFTRLFCVFWCFFVRLPRVCDSYFVLYLSVLCVSRGLPWLFHLFAIAV